MKEKILQYIEELCTTPSPTGYTQMIETYLMDQFQRMGYTPYQTIKGGVIVPIQEGSENGLLLSAHMDTLGLMVRSIKENGRLKVTPLGGFPLSYVEQENVTIHTRGGKTYTGVFRLNEPAVHGSKEPQEAKRDESTMEVVIDAITDSREETVALGISAGDFISLDPRFRVDNGFVKSRHLDDKASVGVLLALAEEVKEEKMTLSRPLYMMFTNYEEVGHGASSGHPAGITEMVAVDMGVVYDDLETDETKVSICAKDSTGPFNYELTGKLIDIAKEEGIDYAVDIYPFYGSDTAAALSSNHDYAHALVGYERTHESGLMGLFVLLHSLIQK